MKVKDLGQDKIEQLIKLECQNILPVLSSVGIKISEIQMRQEVESFREDQIVVSEVNGIIEGFVIYWLINNNELQIKTFNLGKFNNLRLLKDLFNKIINELEQTNIEIIKSQAHVTNIRSINIHRKMGFKEVFRDEKRIGFIISRDDLIKVLSSRLKSIQ